LRTWRTREMKAKDIKRDYSAQGKFLRGLFSRGVR
jgi:hypothetical protein